jgi:hypothetical protein
MKTRLNSSAMLTASALLIGALVIVQAGRIMSGTPAQADLVAASGTLTALTAESTNSNDVLLVLDGRAEELMVYKVENQNAVELYRKYNVPRLMSEARGRHSGRK